MSKINMFKMDVWTFWSKLLSYYAFYIVPNCIKNHHTDFEIARTIFTYLIKESKKPKIVMPNMDILTFW